MHIGILLLPIEPHRDIASCGLPCEEFVCQIVGIADPEIESLELNFAVEDADFVGEALIRKRFAPSDDSRPDNPAKRLFG